MNSSSDWVSQITTVYDVDVDSRRRSNHILELPPGYDEEQTSLSQTSHTVTHQSRNPPQGFISPLGAPQEVASVNSASHHSNYRPVPQGTGNVAPQQHQLIAVPPSVDQHHNQPYGYHPAAAPPHIAQRNQIPIDEISVRQGYQQGNMLRQIFPGNHDDHSNNSSYSYQSGGPPPDAGPASTNGSTHATR